MPIIFDGTEIKDDLRFDGTKIEVAYFENIEVYRATTHTMVAGLTGNIPKGDGYVSSLFPFPAGTLSPTTFKTATVDELGTVREDTGGNPPRFRITMVQSGVAMPQSYWTSAKITGTLKGGATSVTYLSANATSFIDTTGVSFWSFNTTDAGQFVVGNTYKIVLE